VPSSGERARINRYLGAAGLATLEDPRGLVAQLGFLVEDHEHFKRILIKCEPLERRNLYESLRPHLSFEPKPLDVYVAEAGAAAESQQLPTVDAEGKLHAYRVQDIRTIERLVDEALSNFHLSVTCRKCTKSATFHGHSKRDAVHNLRQAGWTWDEITGDGLEICPDCPAVRS
jgi:hypothetical protein